MKLHFHFITLFPETIKVWLSSSILGRAESKGIFSFHTYQLRDFSTDKHRAVDDVAYGGGGGMVLRVEPLVTAVENIQEEFGRENTFIIYFSPAGHVLNQNLLQNVRQYAHEKRKEHFVLICGHYEGVDQRFIDNWVDLEVSLGDFVVTGGELPALVFSDAIIRQSAGTLGRSEAHLEESFSLKNPMTGASLLEYPHYTRPPEYRGHWVPDVLVSGNHEKIKEWRLARAKEKTVKVRPDLVRN